MRNSIFLALILLLIVSCKGGSQQYYVDSDNGDDSNSGRSPEKAWASLEKVNSMEFKAGDQLLFKSGTEFFGQLEPKGIGTGEAPIQINRYGEGKNPAIHGNGEDLHTLLLHNVEYWEVRNLEITNTGKERAAGRRGVIVKAEDFGDCHHIILDSLEIHHVNGSLVKSDGGGSAILWQNSGDSVKTRFIGLQITNCHLHHCERNGINSRGYTNRKEWHPSLNVVVRNNLLEQIPGDGIVPIGTEGALIEYNVMRDCPDILSHEEAAAGIWPWSADNTIIQFNEVSGHKAKWDGQGFDSDWNCQNTIIQYNYSHDNYGGFLLVCNNGSNVRTDRNIGTTNTIVRYNVSVNDGIRPYETERRSWFAPTIHISGPVEDTKIYNNVFIIPEKSLEENDRTVVEMDNWGGPWPENTFFANNIVYADEKADFFFDGDKGTQFTHNCFIGHFESLPADPAAIFEDPQFVDVSARGEGFEVLKNFMLQKTSPCKDAGIAIENSGGQDLFGNPLEGKTTIGVHEF
ncbi:right-handed parallel beta-helix repeat-containing protein [uncultured Sunxiuqinia sp.]|uniref:right-handed parallel beta-helix repeat-containing protein n=1 Tax=uncultured Sunxiuqinia sp. TaxID=1573825 RepID=UPI0030DA487B